MNELMRDEILDQPKALQQSLPSLRTQFSSLLSSMIEPRRMIFTGSGDSYIAPLALEYAARHYLTADIHVIAAQDAAHYWRFDKKDILVAISISGEAVRTIEAAQMAKEAGAWVLTITTHETSSLARISDTAAIIPFRSRSRRTPHTIDYLTSLLAIAILIETLGGHHFVELDTLSGLVADSLTVLETVCYEAAQTFTHQERFYFLGAGPSFGTAQYAAAKFWEAGGLGAFAFELEEFAHGPHLLVEADDPIFIVSPAGNCLDRALLIIEGLKKLRLNIFAITDIFDAFSDIQTFQIPLLPEVWSPFLTSLPVQWLCWAVATVKGYDVVTKNGRHPNPEVYELAHRIWVRGSP